MCLLEEIAAQRGAADDDALVGCTFVVLRNGRRSRTDGILGQGRGGSDQCERINGNERFDNIFLLKDGVWPRAGINAGSGR